MSSFILNVELSLISVVLKSILKSSASTVVAVSLARLANSVKISDGHFANFFYTKNVLCR